MEKPETAADYQRQLSELRNRVGSARITTQPGAEISVDGQAIGTAPLAHDIFLDPGLHRLSARSADGQREHDLEVKPGQTYNIELEIAPTPAPRAASASTSLNPAPRTEEPARDQRFWTPQRTTVALLGGGLTLIAAGVGIGYRIDAGSKQDRADRLRADAQREQGGNCAAASASATCQSLADTLSARNDSGQISNIAFIASGVLLISSVATWMLLPGKPAASAQVYPIAHPRFSGLAMKGAF